MSDSDLAARLSSLHHLASNDHPIKSRLGVPLHHVQSPHSAKPTLPFPSADTTPAKKAAANAVAAQHGVLQRKNTPRPGSSTPRGLATRRLQPTASPRLESAPLRAHEPLPGDVLIQPPVQLVPEPAQLTSLFVPDGTTVVDMAVPQVAVEVAVGNPSAALPQPVASGTHSLAPWIPSPEPLSQQAIQVRDKPRHLEGRTDTAKTAAYGAWGVLTAARLALVAAKAGTEGIRFFSFAGPIANLGANIFSAIDAAYAQSDKKYAHRDYEHFQDLYGQALHNYREMASHVTDEPLDAESQQLLEAARYLVGQTSTMLKAFENGYFSPAKATRLQKRRELAHQIDETNLTIRQTPSSDQDTLKGLLDKNQALRKNLEELPQESAPGQEELKVLKKKARLLERYIARLDKTIAKAGVATPDENEARIRASERLSTYQETIERLSPFFDKSSRPELFRDVDEELGYKQIKWLRDYVITCVTAPPQVALNLLNLFFQCLPVGEVAAAGLGVAGPIVSLLLLIPTWRFSTFELADGLREHKAAVEGHRAAHAGLQHAVALKQSFETQPESDRTVVGLHIARNLIASSIREAYRQKNAENQSDFRSLKATVTRWFSVPVAGILGATGLTLTVNAGIATGVFLGMGAAAGTAATFATGGIVLGVAFGVAGIVAALYYGSIAFRRWQSKRYDKDPAKKRQAAKEHVENVLGRERAHQLMTASQSQAQKLLKEVQASAPKGLRKQLRAHALLGNNEHMVSSWAAEEIRRAQQHTRDGHIPPSLVQEMAVKLTLPADLVQYLLSCRPWCESNEAYYQTCYRTILATVFKAKVYEADRLPDPKPATAPKAAKNILYGLLSEPRHAALLQQVQHAPSPQALHPSHISDVQQRLDMEERLAALRSDLLQAQVDPDDLRRLLHRMIRDASFADDRVVPPVGTVSADKLRWLLVALSDPLRDTQAEPLPAAPVAPPLPAPLVSYTVLDEAIKLAGNEERSTWSRKLNDAGYRTPNPMGTAKQYLENPTPARTEAVLRALTKLLLKFEEVEVDGKLIKRPIVPEGHESLEAWQLAILKAVQKQSEAIGGHLEEGTDKHKTRKAATTRVNRWAMAAQNCTDYVYQQHKKLLLKTTAQHLVLSA